MALAVVSVMVLFAGMALTVKSADKKEVEAAADRAQAIYVAEAGVAEALGSLYQATLIDGVPPEEFGEPENPRSSQGGEYWSRMTDNGNGTYTVRSTGAVDGRNRTLEVVVAAQAVSPVYSHSIFAGNSSNDRHYVMKFGGKDRDGEADDIEGDVYSGGDIHIWHDAHISGAVRAKGKILGPWRGEEKVEQPIPDIAGMRYDENHDFNVAALFATERTWRHDDAGGHAFQVPEDNPAHIFRLNPTDRARSANGMDDYFLEDPYEPVRRDAEWDGSDAYPITLTGTSGDPGPDSSEAIFFIDGNLWIHNGPTFSFKFVHDLDEEVHVTFVVRGNITFSDNVFYEDRERDGIAFVAIKKEGEADSGNIYFGDPTGGTLEYMDGFMYAENDFIDVNLSASGSKRVTVHGNMTAGNQVRIERTYGNRHSKLTVDYDGRIRDGDIELPGLPSTNGALGEAGYTVLAWREVSSEYENAPSGGSHDGGTRDGGTGDPDPGSDPGGDTSSEGDPSRG